MRSPDAACLIARYRSAQLDPRVVSNQAEPAHDTGDCVLRMQRKAARGGERLIESFVIAD